MLAVQEDATCAEEGEVKSRLLASPPLLCEKRLAAVEEDEMKMEQLLPLR